MHGDERGGGHEVDEAERDRRSGARAPPSATSANAVRLHRRNRRMPSGIRRRLSTADSQVPTASAPKNAPRPQTMYSTCTADPRGSRPKFERATDGNRPTNGRRHEREQEHRRQGTRASTCRWRAMSMPVVSACATRGRGGWPGEFGSLRHEERPDQEQVRRGVDDEDRPTRACRTAASSAASAGPSDPAAVDHRRVEGDRSREVVAVDEHRDARAERRRVERVGDADRRVAAANSVHSGASPAISTASAIEHDHHDALHRDDETGAVDPVGEDAGGEREQQQRAELDEDQQADECRPAGAAVEVGRQREVLHPRADVRQCGADEQDPEPRVRQRRTSRARRVRMARSGRRGVGCVDRHGVDPPVKIVGRVRAAIGTGTRDRDGRMSHEPRPSSTVDDRHRRPPAHDDRERHDRGCRSHARHLSGVSAVRRRSVPRARPLQVFGVRLARQLLRLINWVDGVHAPSRPRSSPTLARCRRLAVRAAGDPRDVPGRLVPGGGRAGGGDQRGRRAARPPSRSRHPLSGRGAGDDHDPRHRRPDHARHRSGPRDLARSRAAAGATAAADCRQKHRDRASTRWTHRQIRPFWAAVLDVRRSVDGDVVDPRRQGPPMWFQQMDAPRTERNRIHLDVSVPHDVAEERVAAALAAGGTLVNDRRGQRVLGARRRRRQRSLRVHLAGPLA